MDEREMSTIAGGQEGRGRLGEMFPDDGRIADLPIALGQLETGEADGTGVVCGFGLLQSKTLEGDRTRLIAARRR